MAYYELKLCSICAWRADCKKRFSGSDNLAINCSEFTKDITIKEKDLKNERHPRPDKGKDK